MMETRSKTGEEYNTHQNNCQTSIESLPVDVIFDILVRVPAEDVHNSAQLVCRKWYKIINTRDFKPAHLHRSTFGILVSFVNDAQSQLNFFATGSKDDLIEISKLSYRPQHKVLSSCCNGLISCCNGLVLEARDSRYFYITNPITRQNLDLPPFPTARLPPSYSNDNIARYASAIAYVATTMEYKVVRPFNQYDFRSQDNFVAILTVGVDKDWTRLVNTQHLSLQAKKLLKEVHPLTTQGFVHWARDEKRVTWAEYERKYGHVLTLNVETEIITQFPVPSFRDFLPKVTYLPMGSYLSLLIWRSEFSWELWEMNPETGEWTEMPSIDMEAHSLSFTNYILNPVGWMRPREVLFFSVTVICVELDYPPPVCFAFNVHTRKLQKFTMEGYIYKYLVHRNSLLWINGC